MIRYFSLLLFAVVLLIPGKHKAQDSLRAFPPIPDSMGRYSIFDAMAAHPDSLLEMHVYTDLSQLIRTRTKEAYQDGRLAYTNPDGRRIEHGIELKARGVTRKEICLHPPVKVKWKRKVLDSLGFSKHHEMKVVWQCKLGKHYEQILLREFMVYRLYNLISPYSFRVQLAQIHLTDAKTNGKEYVKYAFFLEDEAQFKERISGVFIEEPVVSSSSLMRQELLIFYVFQYMIGNTDWSLGNLHNMKVLELSAHKKRVLIPYDFDYAGLVSAAYAIPHESLPIKDVRERYYKGVHCTEAEIEALNQFFRGKKQEVMAYCAAFPFLDGASKKDVLAYLAYFFEILDRKDGLHQVISVLKPQKE